MLTKLSEQLELNPGTVAVIRRGKPIVAMMTWEDYESIMETLEILDDSELMENLSRSIKEIKDKEYDTHSLVIDLR